MQRLETILDQLDIRKVWNLYLGNRHKVSVFSIHVIDLFLSWILLKTTQKIFENSWSLSSNCQFQCCKKLWSVLSLQLRGLQTSSDVIIYHESFYPEKGIQLYVCMRTRRTIWYPLNDVNLRALQIPRFWTSHFFLSDSYRKKTNWKEKRRRRVSRVTIRGMHRYQVQSFSCFMRKKNCSISNVVWS